MFVLMGYTTEILAVSVSVCIFSFGLLLYHRNEEYYERKRIQAHVAELMRKGTLPQREGQRISHNFTKMKELERANELERSHSTELRKVDKTHSLYQPLDFDQYEIHLLAID
jgi:hypothetical protein